MSTTSTNELGAIASPWLDAKMAAAYARVHLRVIRGAARTGALRAARIGGRRELRIRIEWLDDWLTSLAPTGDGAVADQTV